VISRAALTPWLRRPLVLAAFALVALAALLSGGLVVAHAVDGAASPETSASPAAGGNGDNNVAAGVNTKDGKTVYALRLKIVQVASDSVDATNAAVAVNSGCTDCSTVAVAFEGVIVIGSPSDFQPTNLALAMNESCSGCTAFADAYQQVVQTSTRVRITKQGRKEIARIRQDLNDLKHADLTLDQIRARVAADEQAFAAVLRTQLTPVGHVQEPAPQDAPDVSDSPDTAAAESSASAAPASDAASPTAAEPSAAATSPSESSSPTAEPATSEPSPSASPTP
jgi:putative peptide zinc metalloprotease protein